MLEDKEAKIVGGATTVKHDVKTGRLFITGMLFSLLKTLVLTTGYRLFDSIYHDLRSTRS